MFHRLVAGVAAGFLLAATVPARAANVVTPNDAARFLAGMAPSPESPLTPLTKDRPWQQHARFFESAFGQLEQRQLSKIRAWSSANLTAPRSTMFYMFSGPDFLYADVFFPKANTYVLSALEPIGSVPDLLKLPRGSIGPTLNNVQRSLYSILSFSFFITKQMKTDLRAGQVNGVLPILYVFLARSGKTIRAVSPISVDDAGVLNTAPPPARANVTRGVRILFAGSDNVEKTLYYFSTNIANDGVRSGGFLKFFEGLSPADSLVKSASYLMHSPNFSTIRTFLLNNSATIVQDDSGIPLSYFDPARWQVSPFGRYLGPIDEFPGRRQPKLAELFKKSRPIDFDIGYRWRPNESNLMLAIRKP